MRLKFTAPRITASKFSPLFVLSLSAAFLVIGVSMVVALLPQLLRGFAARSRILGLWPARAWGAFH